jgi:hypothetical protein
MNKHLYLAEKAATLLDNKFSIAGIRFGIAPILDAIPAIGDFIAAGLSFYLVWIATQEKAPSSLVTKMVGNIVVNFIISLIPIVGEATYIFRKVNMKNLSLLKEYLETRPVEGSFVTA